MLADPWILDAASPSGPSERLHEIKAHGSSGLIIRVRGTNLE